MVGRPGTAHRARLTHAGLPVTTRSERLRFVVLFIVLVIVRFVARWLRCFHRPNVVRWRLARQGTVALRGPAVKAALEPTQAHAG